MRSARPHGTSNMNAEEGKMLAWEITEYNKPVTLEQIPIPQIKGPYDVLVKVTASSVNPLDVDMIDGYGRVVLNTLRKFDSLGAKVKNPEFPIILGRDFVGVVVNKGKFVTDFNEGDVVLGVTHPHKQGAHAQYVLATDSLLVKKPERLNDEEAASLLYAAITAWSALKISGGLLIRCAKDKKVLVLGGSGGVGSIAVQMLKAWGSTVVTTCSTEAIPFVEELHPDVIIDYKDSNFIRLLAQNGPYDLILDAAGVKKTEIQVYTSNLRSFSLAAFVTLRPPVLPNTDNYGLLLGNVKNVVDLFVDNALGAPWWTLGTIRWGFFLPVHMAIKEIVELASERKIVPKVQHVYNFTEASKAYDHVKKGHLRGKVVIFMDV